MERPWFKFCGRDWLGDLELLRCSIGARGLWIAMLALMNEGTPYGHLADKKGPITVRMLASIQHLTPSICEKLLFELEGNQIFSRTNEGVIFSRRMVRDERDRLAAQARKERFESKRKERPKEQVQSSVLESVRNGVQNSVRASDSDSDSCIGFELKEKNGHANLPPFGFRSPIAPEKLAEGFDALFVAWPEHNRVGEDEAARLWISYVDIGAIVPPGTDVVEGLERWKRSASWAEEGGKFIPSMAKWMREKRWKDNPRKYEPPVPKKTKLQEIMDAI